jgi:hypothetical protein
MNLPKKLWAVPQIVWRWNRAADKRADGQYDAALQEILAAEKTAQRTGISLEPTFRLLKAVLAHQVGDLSLALQSVVEAHKQIKSYRRYHDAERQYLECYASVLGLRIVEESEYTGSHDFSVDYASVDPDKVSGYTRKVFPLRATSRLE